MSTRREICRRCGQQLVVPANVLVIQCGACGRVTKVRPSSNKWSTEPSQHYNPMPLPGGGVYRPSLSGSHYRLMPAPVGSQPPAPGPGRYGRPGRYGLPGPIASLSAPPAHGRRKAVLCGVSYRHKSYRLKGSVNDVRSMKRLLVETLGFPIDCILTLTEDETSPLRIPIKKNMVLAMRWLVHDSQPGDSLLFHFSGHGSRRDDHSGDEIDGVDETLCPLDYDEAGPILDDEINAIIVRPLPRGATLHAVVDSCYSGTVLDLPFHCRMNRKGNFMWEDHRNPAGYTGTSGGRAICFSACDDHQSSGNTSAFTGKQVTGAMTFSFTQAVQNEPGSTYGRLLNSMRFIINKAKSDLSLNPQTADTPNNASQSPQVPQLSSSEKFDIHAKKFMV